METLNHSRKGINRANKIIAKFLFFAFTIVCSLQTKGQAVCIAVIDSGRNEICVSSGAVTFSNAVASGENIQWLSSGDGIFNNRFSQNPTYIPGPADIAAGYVFIYLDVYKDDPADFCSELPVITLNLGTMNTKATPASQSICTGSSITTIQLNGGISGTTYNWTRDNTASVTGIAASGAGNITGTLTNTTGTPVTVTFTITPKSATCTGTPITATVVVSPKPNAVASVSSQTICSRANITPITLSGNMSGATYNWTRNNTTSVTGIAASGSGNITGALTKTSGSTTTTVTFTITPTLGGCNGTAITSTVAVSPSAVAVTGTPSSQTICSGSNITTITAAGGTTGTTYTWTRNNTTTVTGIAASGSGNISGALTNTNTAPEYVTFTITRSSSTCTNRATVLVKPVPVATATPLTQTICSGVTITPVTLTSSISGTTFNWTRNNTASVTGITASGSGNISGTLINTSTAPVTVTFSITPTANGCSGTPITTTVIVNPTPGAAVTTPSSQTICSGTTITQVDLSAAVSGATFNWTRDNTVAVTGIAANGSGNITGDLTNTTYAPVAVTFTITPAANGCQGTPAAATIIVNPRPSAIISGSQSICSSSPNISIALTGTAPWNFTYTDGTTPVTVNNNSANPYTFTVPAASKTYTVISLNDAYCTAQAADITGSAVISQLSYTITTAAGNNGTITPNGATSINCGASQTYNITANTGFNIQDVLVDGVSAGAVSTYTFSNVTATHTISASFSPASVCTAPTLSTSVTNILCNSSNTGAINLTTTGGAAPFTYAWTGPNGFTAATEDILGIPAGAYSVVVTASGGCSTSSTATLTQPVTALTATLTAGVPACNATSTTLVVKAAGGTGTRQYSLNGGAFQTASTFTGTTAGSPYTVTVKDANGCTVATNTVKVEQASAVPATPAGIDGPVYGLCGGGNFTYTVQPVPGATSYYWSLPTGFTAVSGQNTGQIVVSVPSTFTGTSGIWATPKNGCGSGTGLRLALNSTLSYATSSMSGPATITAGQAGVQYSLPFTAEASYNWLVPTGTIITAGQGSNIITITFGTTGGNVSAAITNACGTGSRVSKSVIIAVPKPLPTQQLKTKPGLLQTETGTKTSFSVYPNPAQNEATAVFNSLKAGTRFEVTISNSLGKVVLTKSGMATAGKNTVQFEPGKFTNGIYLVRLITGDTVQTLKLLKGR